MIYCFNEMPNRKGLILLQAKKTARILLTCTGSLLVAILVGCLLMTCVYALPTGRMQTKVSESIASIDTEGGSFSWAPGYSSARLDGYTDNIMMQTAVFEGSGNPLQDAMLNQRMVYPKADLYPGQALINYVYGARNGEAISYGRYWHGYLLFLKPLLLFFNLSDIRMFNMMLQWTLCMMLMLLAYRKAGFRLALPLGVSILALNPLSAALSFQYSSMYLLTLIACIVQLSLELYNKSHGWLLYLWLGILTAFFDFLTYPPAALGICLILGLVLKAGSAKEKLACAVGSGLAWGVGYAGMWSGKWLVGTLITGQNILADAMETAQYRAGSQSTAAEGGSSLSFGQVLLKNLGVYCNAAGLLLLLALLMLLGCLIIRGGYRFQRGSGNLPALAAVALIPFAWYFVLRNHSGVHYWMTHRNLSISIMAITCLIGFSLDKNGGPDHG